jgi:hypothetical protein
MAAVKESTRLRKLVLLLLNSAGAECWAHNVLKPTYRNKAVSKSGIPDVIGVSPNGKWICVEIKAGRDVLSRYQFEFMTRMSRRGAIVAVIRNDQDAHDLLRSCRDATWSFGSGLGARQCVAERNVVRGGVMVSADVASSVS